MLADYEWRRGIEIGIEMKGESRAGMQKHRGDQASEDPRLAAAEGFKDETPNR